MNPYELMLIFDPNLGEEKINQLLTKIEDKIIKAGGEHLKTDKWGVRRLAGTFRKAQKLTQAYFVLVYFNAPSAAPAALQAFLKVTENIIRYSIYRSTEKKDEPLAEIEGTPLEEKKIG